MKTILKENGSERPRSPIGDEENQQETPSVMDPHPSPAEQAGMLDTSVRSTTSTCSSGFASGADMADGGKDIDIENDNNYDELDDTWYVCSGSEVMTDAEDSFRSSMMTVSDVDDSLISHSHSQTRTTIQVPEVITSSTSSGSKITLYKINIQSTDICFHTPSSCVWRSYSDFVWLRRRILSSCSFVKKAIPDLPSRNLLNLFDKDFAETRRQGLQEFLRQILVDRALLSDAALHLFLQSNLGTAQIQEWLEGRLDGSVVELVHKGKELHIQDDSLQSKT